MIFRKCKVNFSLKSENNPIFLVEVSDLQIVESNILYGMCGNCSESLSFYPLIRRGNEQMTV
ncbi:MAG: hypothetical protein CVT94_19320 [Bacteroidetes bacterium HGW-Bacteroidetes-11]|nr:MAG: hypothetical protein CVT94_19320 [Bacteroidetes bacterium HGW-Bacteroidetes-11]